MRNFQLKNVQYLAANSRDSHCFSATLYVDGKRFCTVSDDGWGGATMFEPVNGQKYNELQGRVAEYDAELLGEFGSETYDRQDGSTFTMANNTLEYVVCNLINEWLEARDLRQAMSRKLIFTIPGKDGIYECKKPKGYDPNEAVDMLQRIHGEGAQVLNAMPISDALKLWQSA